MWTGETFKTGGSKRWLVQKGSMAKALRKGIHLCVPKTPHMFRNSTDRLWGVCYSATRSWAKQSELGTKYYSRKQLFAHVPVAVIWDWTSKNVSKAWPPHQAKFNDLIRFQNFQLVVASQKASKCTANSANTFAIFALISELTESLSFGPNSKPSKATRACHTAQDAVCTGTWSWAYKEDKIRIKFWLLVMLPIYIVYLACCWVIMSWYSKKATPTSSSMISNSTEPWDLHFQVSEQLSNTFKLANVFHCLSIELKPVSKYQPHWGASWFAFLILLERIKLQLPKSDQQLFDSLLLTSAIGSTASKCTELFHLVDVIRTMSLMSFTFLETRLTALTKVGIQQRHLKTAPSGLPRQKLSEFWKSCPENGMNMASVAECSPV